MRVKRHGGKQQLSGMNRSGVTVSAEGTGSLLRPHKRLKARLCDNVRACTQRDCLSEWSHSIRESQGEIIVFELQTGVERTRDVK